MAKRRGNAPRRAGGDDRRLFLDRTARVLGWTPERVAQALSGPRRASARINPLSPLGAEEVAARLGALDLDLVAIPWCPGAFEIHGDKRVLAESDLFTGGHVYIQNAASLVPPLALDPRPGQRILDLCAAPGGKSTFIAGLTGNGAELWLNDGLPARMGKLREITATFHVRVAEMTNHPAQYADKFLEGPFDRILLDAQCGGEGMIDMAHTTALRYWSLARIEKYRRLQQRMVMSAARLLAPGGVLVYSTCTFAPEENEAPLDHLLRHRDDMRAVPIDLEIPGRLPGLRSWAGMNFHPDLVHAVRIAPQPWLEGFFVCRLEKAAG